MRQVLSGSSEGQLSKPASQRHAPINRQEMLRTKRSQRYIEALRRLDAGGALADPAALASLREAITAEFPESELAPRGWVAKCYLGVPYEVHTLDATGAIVRHYRWGEPLPPTLERARSLARSGRYLVIEVHADRLIAIADDGATSVCTT